ncbi:MAG TPA: hypothetical protein VIE65_17815 [Methylobacter sp.]|jgi:hypothetical protein
MATVSSQKDNIAQAAMDAINELVAASELSESREASPVTFKKVLIRITVIDNSDLVAAKTAMSAVRELDI